MATILRKKNYIQISYFSYNITYSCIINNEDYFVKNYCAGNLEIFENIIKNYTIIEMFDNFLFVIKQPIYLKYILLPELDEKVSRYIVIPKEFSKSFVRNTEKLDFLIPKNYLNNLEKLEIMNIQKDVDITFLDYCTELKELDIILINFNLFENLKTLVKISLKNNDINDLSCLKNLPKLEDLTLVEMNRINYNHINNLNLKKCYFEKVNRIKMNGNFNLEKLCIYFSEVDNGLFLINLKNLKILEVNTIEGNFLNFIQDCKSIEELSLLNVRNFKINYIQDLPNLKKLFLYNICLEDINFTQNLTNLVNFTMLSCHIWNTILHLRPLLTCLNIESIIVKKILCGSCGSVDSCVRIEDVSFGENVFTLIQKN